MNIDCAGVITHEQLRVLKEAAMVPLKTQVFPVYEAQQKDFRVLRHQKLAGFPKQELDCRSQGES